MIYSQIQSVINSSMFLFDSLAFQDNLIHSSRGKKLIVVTWVTEFTIQWGSLQEKLASNILNRYKLQR